MSRCVPSRLVIGGDQPFVRRLIRVSTSPLVGSIYNMGVWDKVAAAWVNVETRRTLDREEAARRRYKETGRSLENGGCIGDPHIVVDRCMVFICILHCCMAIGRLQVAFIETRLVDLPKENTDAVQRVLYRARTGVKLGATGAPDGEEARALFLAWEELGPLLDYVPEDGEWQAVVAMRDLLRELYTDKPPRGDLRAAEVARAYRAHCCKEACESNYLLYLEEDVTEAVANARRLGVGLGAVCADVVESLNAILKRAYNDHSGRGGGGMPAATQVEREGEVVSQVWEWWFLKFDLPLRNYGTPHTAPCTMAKLMATHSPPPSTLASPPLALFSPCPRRLGHAKDVGRHVQSEQRSPGVFCLCMLACVYELIFPSIRLIFRD